MPNYCPNCGNKIDTTDEFCTKCGYSLVDKKRTFNKLHIILIALVILIAAVGGIIGYFLFDGSDIKTVDIGIATFECSKDLNFILTETDDKMGFKNFEDPTGTYSVKVWDFSNVDMLYYYTGQYLVEYIKTFPSFNVDGIVVYNATDYMENNETYTYTSIINENMTLVYVNTPNLNETAAITKSFHLK